MEKRSATRPRLAAVDSSLGSLDGLLHETAVLFHRMRQAAEELHGQGEMSGGRRSVLRELERLGPRTVPQMARSRSSSRQHVQMLVNELAADGSVELVSNPAHKRSRLVRLTRRGSSLVDRMNRREARLFPALGLDVTARELASAAATLRRVRNAFDGEAWRRAIRRPGANGREAEPRPVRAGRGGSRAGGPRTSQDKRDG